MEGWFVHGGKVFIGRPAIGKDNERGLRLPSLKSFEECNLIINRVSWVPISKHDLQNRGWVSWRQWNMLLVYQSGVVVQKRKVFDKELLKLFSSFQMQYLV